MLTKLDTGRSALPAPDACGWAPSDSDLSLRRTNVRVPRVLKGFYCRVGAHRVER